MSQVETLSKPRDCRCSNCGYIHVSEKVDAVPSAADLQAAVPTVPVVASPPQPEIVQQVTCPLCREVFTDADVYYAHRLANCQTPDSVPTDPPVTDPPVDEPAPPPEV